MSGESIEEEPVLRVVHEAERQRQHARYRIAAAALVEGHRVGVQNWSLGGICLSGLESPLPPDRDLELQLEFDFDVIKVGLEIRARVVWQDEAAGQAGLGFVDLGDREISALRYVIDAFLAGDVVSTGDLIHVIRRDNFAPPRAEAAAAGGEEDPTGRLVRTGLMAGLLLILLTFSISTLYRRAHAVEARWAVVEAPLVVVRSPQPSYFRPIELVEGRVLDTGDNVALVELVGGGAVAIDSPCRCSIVSVHARERAFVGQGEPLVSLMPEGEPVYVRAAVSWEDLKSMVVGDRAEIRLGSGELIDGRVARIEAGSTQALRLSAPLKGEPSTDEGLAEVLIHPVRPLPVTRLDEAVWVTVRTGTAE